MIKVDLQMFGELPAELDGVSAETIKEIMGDYEKEEADTTSGSGTPADNKPNEDKPAEETHAEGEKATEPLSNEGKEEPPKPTEVEPTAEADSDNKQVGEQQGEHQIPYARFKQVNEENKQLKAKNEEFQKKLDNLIARLDNAPALQTEQKEQPAVEKPSYDKDTIDRLDAEATRRAGLALGLTQEDIDGLEYSDDYVLKRRFETARRVETENILKKAQEIEAQDRARKAEAESVYKNNLTELSKSIEAETKEVGLDKYNEILQYGSDIVVPSLSQLDQQAVIEANERVLKKVPTPSDIVILRNVFQLAKQQYLSTAPVATAQTNKTQLQEKIQQAKALPKANQVKGANDNNGGSYTQEQLQKFLEMEDWDKVPEDAKKILMGGSY